jgi:hypothetical protein
MLLRRNFLSGIFATIAAPFIGITILKTETPAVEKLKSILLQNPGVGKMSIQPEYNITYSPTYPELGEIKSFTCNATYNIDSVFDLGAPDRTPYIRFPIEVELDIEYEFGGESYSAFMNCLGVPETLKLTKELNIDAPSDLLPLIEQVDENTTILTINGHEFRLKSMYIHREEKNE